MVILIELVTHGDTARLVPRAQAARKEFLGHVAFDARTHPRFHEVGQGLAVDENGLDPGTKFRFNANCSAAA